MGEKRRGRKCDHKMASGAKRIQPFRLHILKGTCEKCGWPIQEVTSREGTQIVELEKVG